MIARLLTFAGKAHRRGFAYVGAVSRFQAGRLRYHLRLGDSSRQDLTLAAPRFHFTEEDIPRIVTCVPEHLRQQTVREADQIVQRSFSFRSKPAVRFAGNPDWELAPEGNRSWTWDLNRHRYFLTLGMAYHYATREVYLSTLTQHWDDWIHCNPQGKGANWQSPFEVAARLRNWIWAYFFLAAAEGCSPAFLLRLQHHMHEHARFLADHLEYHWPNNHLLLEALTLYQFALLFENESSTHAQLAWHVLEREIPAQVLEDGTHAELCSMYHEIVAGELSALVQLCRLQDCPLPAEHEQRIERMKKFSAALRRQDGSNAPLGESCAADTCMRFDTVEPIRSDLNYWLRAGTLAAAPQESARKVSIAMFPEGGYAVLRAPWATEEAHVTLDCGPFSRCQAANHAHCDALSFELHAGGQNWIVDPGFFYPWKQETDWPGYFRSTGAHNTLVIDGREQSEVSNFWEVRRVGRTRLRTHTQGAREAIIEAETEPYWSEDGEVIHRRRLWLNDNGELRIRDRVLGRKRRHLQWFFHFSPQIDIKAVGAGSLTAQSQTGQTLTCDVHTPLNAGAWKLIRGQRDPLQGWVAISSARVAPAWVAMWETEAELPVEIEFHFRLECWDGTEKTG